MGVKMKYYIGVDGGGTKTQFALFDENKNLLSSVYTSGSNHENLEGSFVEAADIIVEGITKLLEENNLQYSDIEHTLMGLAGIDHPYQHEAMVEELTDRGYDRFSIYNDGFIVTKAGTTKKAAIGYNCGTGTCCNSIDSRGNMLQIGGFGELSGDAGNGSWVAIRAFKLVYDEICLVKHKSLITKLFSEKFSVAPERDEFLATIAMLMGLKQDEYTRGLIDIFFEAAAAGDEVVLESVEEMADRGADFISAQTKLQQFDDDEVDVVLSGSIHTKLPSDMYIERLMEKARAKSTKKLNFIKLSVPPVTGCINWMLEDK
jgi:N-acetylglucosamine kinase-like BadF-type ATPase